MRCWRTCWACSNSLPELRKLIMEKAGGNPFFVEELIRSLIETGQIVRENSHWKAAAMRPPSRCPTRCAVCWVHASTGCRSRDGTSCRWHRSSGGRSTCSVLERLAKVDGLDRELMRLKEAGLVERPQGRSPCAAEHAFATT